MQVIHFPDDPATYALPPGGPEIILAKTDPSGATEELGRLRPVLYGTTRLPDGFVVPPPPARPPPIISIQNEFDIHLHGVVVPADQPELRSGPSVDQFLAHSRFRFPVGWQAIEIYPPIGIEHWKSEYAPLWAEMDLLAVIVQRNTLAAALNGLDGRTEARRQIAHVLEEFANLLEGPEEPVHQFLKRHRELLCATSDNFWSKLPFGDRVSDFVFREPYNDYLLVEIEAPVRELFRRDGQQREELTHAINQIADWIQYIGNNKQKVETELGLVGISTNPRSLVIIGRSASLTDDNRRKLVTLQTQHPSCASSLTTTFWRVLARTSRRYWDHLVS